MDFFNNKLLINGKYSYDLKKLTDKGVKIQFLSTSFTCDQLNAIQQIIHDRDVKLVFTKDVSVTNIKNLFTEVKYNKQKTTVVLDNIGKTLNCSDFLQLDVLGLQLMKFDIQQLDINDKISINNISIIDSQLSANAYQQIQKQVQSLELVNCQLYGILAENITSQVGQLLLTKLIYQNDYVQNAFMNVKYEALQCLQISRCNLFDQQFEMIIQNQTFNFLRYLDLSHNFLTSESIGTLVKYEQRLPRINIINLSHNKISSQFQQYDIFSHFPGVTLNISNNLVYGLNQNMRQSLHTLICSNNYIHNIDSIQFQPQQHQFPLTDLFFYNVTIQPLDLLNDIQFIINERYFKYVYIIQKNIDLSIQDFDKDTLLNIEVTVTDDNIDFLLDNKQLLHYINVNQIILKRDISEHLIFQYVFMAQISCATLRYLQIPNLLVLHLEDKVVNEKQLYQILKEQKRLMALSISLPYSDAILQKIQSINEKIIYINFIDKFVQNSPLIFDSFDEISAKALFVLQFVNNCIDIDSLKINPQYLEEINEIVEEIHNNQPNVQPITVQELNIDHLQQFDNENQQIDLNYKQNHVYQQKNDKKEIINQDSDSIYDYQPNIEDGQSQSDYQSLSNLGYKVLKSRYTDYQDISDQSDIIENDAQPKQNDQQQQQSPIIEDWKVTHLQHQSPSPTYETIYSTLKNVPDQIIQEHNQRGNKLMQSIMRSSSNACSKSYVLKQSCKPNAQPGINSYDLQNCSTTNIQLYEMYFPKKDNTSTMRKSKRQIKLLNLQ